MRRIELLLMLATLAGCPKNDGGGNCTNVDDCGSKDGGSKDGGNTDGGKTDGGNTALTLSQFATQANAKACPLVGKCAFNEANYLVQACKDGQLVFNGAAVQTAISAGRLAYDASHAQACLDAIAAATCNGSGITYVIADCRATLRGTVASGGACDSALLDLECAHGMCGPSADPNAPVCASTCTPYLVFGTDCTAGGTCDPTQGLACVNGKCHAPLDLDEPCANAGDCKLGLSCVNKKCVRPIAGTPCDSFANDCAPGFYCPAPDVDAGSACVAQIAQGGSCGEQRPGIAANHWCASDLTCKGFSIEIGLGASTVTQGACAPAAEEGESCVNEPAPGELKVVISGCKTGLACPSGKCQKPPISGACANTANPYFQCLMGAAYCDLNQSPPPCVTAKDNGTECQADGDCKSGNCSNSTCAVRGACVEPSDAGQADSGFSTTCEQNGGKCVGFGAGGPQCPPGMTEDDNLGTCGIGGACCGPSGSDGGS